MRLARTLLIVLSGCSAADPCAGTPGACLVLTVTSMSPLSIDTLRVTASGAIDGAHTAMAGKTVSLPVDVPIALPAGAGGSVDLFVEGLLAGNFVGSGEASLNVNVDGRTRGTVDIEPPVAPPPSTDLGGMMGAPDLGISLDQACADQAHARCSRTAACSTTPPTYLHRMWGDQATCEQRTKLDCTIEATAPGSGRTAAVVERCAASYSAQPCADRFANFQPLACLVSGTRGKGVRCSYDSQCQTGFCRVSAAQACGSCQDATTAAVSSCATTADCSGRQVCAMSVCQLRGALNAACSTQKTCGEELACVANVCKADGSSTGIVCDPSAATQPPCDLDLGLYCANGACAMVAAATPANPQCGLVGGVRTVCTSGGDCFGGMCKPPAADGAACDLMNGPTCRPPARCVVASGTTGTCDLPNPAACT